MTDASVGLDEDTAWTLAEDLAVFGSLPASASASPSSLLRSSSASFDLRRLVPSKNPSKAARTSASSLAESAAGRRGGRCGRGLRVGDVRRVVVSRRSRPAPGRAVPRRARRRSGGCAMSWAPLGAPSAPHGRCVAPGRGRTAEFSRSDQCGGRHRRPLPERSGSRATAGRPATSSTSSRVAWLTLPYSGRYSSYRARSSNTLGRVLRWR